MHFQLSGPFPLPDDPAMALPRYTVAPTQEIPIVRRSRDGVRHASFARWGLIPPGSTAGRRGAARTINARSETVFERSPFRRAVRDRRCLVPATGFLEWKKEGRARWPFHILPAEGSMWAMAGIWSPWRAPDGSGRVTFSVLTTKPNDRVAALHDRMPVILDEAAYSRWLDPSVTERESLEPLFVPIDEERAVLMAVSTRVNNVLHDDPECLAPREPEARKEPQLGFDFG